MLRITKWKSGDSMVVGFWTCNSIGRGFTGGTSQKAVMLWGWEENCRTGNALAMC